jgi:protein SCO1/2
MASITRRTWLSLAALAPVASGLLARHAAASPPPRTRAFGADYFPNVVLRTHDNRAVRFYDDLLKEKFVIINFMYTACADGVCPLTTVNLVRVQQLLGDRVGRDIFMYSLTLTPEHDTPRVLKQYAQAHGVGPGWWFLTGKPKDIELLRRKLGFVDPDPAVDANKSQHIGMIRFGNEALERWAACPGQANPNWIVTSILWMAAPPQHG